MKISKQDGVYDKQTGHESSPWLTPHDAGHVQETLVLINNYYLVLFIAVYLYPD